MKQKLIASILILCLLLSGCSWPDGRYVSVETHYEPPQEEHLQIISAKNYLDLMAAMENLVTAGRETGVIFVPDYDTGTVQAGMAIASSYAMKHFAIGAYAVENVHYEQGTSNGLAAVAVNITYRHSLAELQRIRRVADVAEAEQVIATSLDDCDPRVVLMIESYTETDFVQLVEDYADYNPASVMETPQVTESIYGTGDSRVVELIFTYQNSRDTLRQMKEQVTPVFDAAVLYVSGDAVQRQKFSQLYGFLMERFHYTLETSITPAYSLLHHGVGDSRAFATVYAAMCREAGLECMVVTGTHEGEPWTWNIVRDNGYYYHVDLMRSSAKGFYREFTDDNMDGYVWDYSAYPACNGPSREEDEEPGNIRVPEETEEPSTEATVPEETIPPTLPPEVPEETTQPTVPTLPSEPPVETTVPTLPPEVPGETTVPTVPSEPTTPSTPTTPTTPTVPTTPTTPTTPSQPEPPDEPVQPVNPTESTAPQEQLMHA